MSELNNEYIDMLGAVGFKIPTIDQNERKVCKNIAEVAEYVSQWEERREAYPYEIDGLVVKANSLALQEKCGYTSRFERVILAQGPC